MDVGPNAKSGEVATPRDAATVLLLRPADGGFEVFMVKRSGLSDVLGEAHVFPGGKIDVADSGAPMLERIEGVDAARAATLGDERGRHPAHPGNQRRRVDARAKRSQHRREGFLGVEPRARLREVTAHMSREQHAGLLEGLARRRGEHAGGTI